MGTETKAQYSPGLAGVIAGETAICWVDPAAGLMYRGYDIHGMAEKATFEEVAYLLLNGELPNAKELTDFIQQIASERALPGPVTEMLQLLPSATHPMDMLRTGVSMLGPFDKDLNDSSHDANVRKSIRLIARVSTLITDGWRILHGEKPFPEKPDLTQAANFFYKFDGKIPEQWQTRMLDTIFNLYADHEYNASTFAARVTSSTLADIYAAVTSAVATLKGPLHGGANEESMKMLEEIGTPDQAEAWLMKKLGAKGKIMGFGHRVYKKGDSRVPAMREIARDLGKRTGKENWVPICEKLEEVMDREKQLCANVDLYAAPVFWMLGFPPELNTPLFAASRVAGWCAHVIEQHDNNRLIRPRSLYVGRSCDRIPGRLNSLRDLFLYFFSHDRLRLRGSGRGRSMNADQSLQEKYAPQNRCFGCGAANPDGLHIRSFLKDSDESRKGGEIVAAWKPEKKYEAFNGVLNGGIIGTLLDCHCNWTAAYHLMKRAGENRPPCTVTAEYAIKLMRPTPTNDSVFLSARVVEIADDRATVEGTLSAGGKVCATCRGVFVAVKEGHPAYHRW